MMLPEDLTSGTPIPREAALDPDQLLAQARILVVDDDVDSLGVMAATLFERCGDLRTATSGLEALEIGAAARPHLVILDVRLPDMDGVEVCRRLRELPGLHELPVLLLTAYDAEDLPAEVFEAGGMDYMRKPVRHKELLARIRLHLGVKRARDQLRRRERAWRRLLATSNDGVWVLDARGRTVMANARMEGLVGAKPGELDGEPVFKFLVAESSQGLLAWLRDAQAASKHTEPGRLLGVDGRTRWVRVAASSQRDPAGQRLGVMLSVADVEAQHQLLERQARTQAADGAVRRYLLALAGESVWSAEDFSVPARVFPLMQQLKVGLEARGLLIEAPLVPGRAPTQGAVGSAAQWPNGVPPEAPWIRAWETALSYGERVRVVVDRARPWSTGEAASVQTLADGLQTILARWWAERRAARLRNLLEDRLDESTLLVTRRGQILDAVDRLQAGFIREPSPVATLRLIGQTMREVTGARAGALLGVCEGSGGSDDRIMFGDPDCGAPPSLTPPVGQWIDGGDAAAGGPRSLGLRWAGAAFEPEPRVELWLLGHSGSGFATPSELVALVQAVRTVCEGLAGRERERAARAREVEQRKSLAHANAELERAMATRDQLLGMVSHELRTPLTAVLGLTESMASAVLGPVNEDQVEALLTINRSGKTLLRLVNDLIGLSRASAGLVRAPVEVPLKALLRSVLEAAKTAAREEGVRLVCEPVAESTRAYGDPRAIERVLQNIVDNAVKFSPPSGDVVIELRPPGSAGGAPLSVTVRDAGPGIPPQDMARCFDPFTQLSSGLSRKAGGSGLGLALVRRLCRGLDAGLLMAPAAPAGLAVTLRLASQGPAPDAAQPPRGSELVDLRERHPARPPVATTALTSLLMEAAGSRRLVAVLVELLDASTIEAVDRIRAWDPAVPLVILRHIGLASDADVIKAWNASTLVAPWPQGSPLDSAWRAHGGQSVGERADA